MTWVRLDDQFADHPKIVGLSANAFRLHVTAICYAARQETDGVIPRGAAFVVAGKRYISELIDAALWDAHQGNFLIHDYLEYNPSSASLREKRAADSARKSGGIQPDSKRPGPARTRPVKETAAAGGTHARETSPHWQRAIDAWERQSPGSYNPTIGDALSGWLLDGTPIDWIEKACEAAGHEGGRKGVSYVKAIIRRYRAQGSTEDSREGGSNGRRADDAGADTRGRPVRPGHGPGVGASQRVPGANVDWDAVAAEYGGNPQQADGDVAGPAAGDVGEDV